jgi:hypothetical protein
MPLFDVRALLVGTHASKGEPFRFCRIISAATGFTFPIPPLVAGHTYLGLPLRIIRQPFFLGKR